MPKCHQPLKFSDLNSFLTSFCDNYQRHDYSSCLQWHSNMSPQFTPTEVKKKHLRRVPVKITSNGSAILVYENEKCPIPETCPEKQNCKKCHNEKEFMYHPLVYMTAKCNNGSQCKNRSRFCAFYHTEAERVEAERNREDLLRKINRAKMAKRAPIVDAPEKNIASKWSLEDGQTAVDKLKGKTKQEGSTQVKSTVEPIPNRKPFPPKTGIDEEENSISSNSGKTPQQDLLQRNHPTPYGIDDNENSEEAPNSDRVPLQHPKSNISHRDTSPLIVNEYLRVLRNKPISIRPSSAVYEGLYLDHGIKRSVLVKEIELRYVGDEPLSVEGLLRRHHRNLISYHTVCYKEGYVYIVMEYQHQTLASFVREHHGELIHEKTVTPLCKSFLYQLCSAIVHLQVELRSFHCDLLPDNIFIEKSSSGDHRLIIGDMNRSIRREGMENEGKGTVPTKEMYRYLPPGTLWLSPEERNQAGFSSSEQIYQSDMWRLGMLICYILTGEEYNMEKVSSIHIDLFLKSQPWYTLSSLLLQHDFQLRMTATVLLDHPAFWYFSPTRVSAFYKQIYLHGGVVDIQRLLNSVEKKRMLYPRDNWLELITGRTSRDNLLYPSEHSIARLVQLIFNVITRQESEEYYSAVQQQCILHRISEPIQYFHTLFPCLIFRIWDILFQEKKLIEKQHLAFSDLLSV